MGNILRLAAVLAAAFGLFACSKYDCGQTAGRCPGDPTPSAAELNRCNGWLNDPQCGAAFRTYGTCILDNEECGADGGSGNFGVAQVSCPQEYSAWQTCCQDHADAGACPLTL